MNDDATSVRRKKLMKNKLARSHTISAWDKHQNEISAARWNFIKQSEIESRTFESLKF